MLKEPEVPDRWLWDPGGGLSRAGGGKIKNETYLCLAAEL